jgi:hypothetical protein
LKILYAARALDSGPSHSLTRSRKFTTVIQNLFYLTLQTQPFSKPLTPFAKLNRACIKPWRHRASNILVSHSLGNVSTTTFWFYSPFSWWYEMLNAQHSPDGRSLKILYTARAPDGGAAGFTVSHSIPKTDDYYPNFILPYPSHTAI